MHAKPYVCGAAITDFQWAGLEPKAIWLKSTADNFRFMYWCGRTPWMNVSAGLVNLKNGYLTRECEIEDDGSILFYIFDFMFYFLFRFFFWFFCFVLFFCINSIYLVKHVREPWAIGSLALSCHQPSATAVANELRRHMALASALGNGENSLKCVTLMMWKIQKYWYAIFYESILLSFSLFALANVLWFLYGFAEFLPDVLLPYASGYLAIMLQFS